MSDATNLRIQQQINEAIVERGKLLAAQTKQISDQAELAIAFCKAMKCEDVDRVSERISEIRSGLEAAAKAAEDHATATNASAAAATSHAEEIKKSGDLQKSQLKTTQDFLKVISQVGKIFIDSFSKGFAGVRGFISLINSAATGILNIGQAILAIPLKIFDLMTNKAAELANASYAIATAIEDVREQFGDVNSGLSKDVVSGGREIGNSLSEAGLSIGQAFGIGPEGAAAAIRESNAIAKDLGATVSILGESFNKAFGHLFVFRSGLGLTNEDLKSVVKYSKSVGTSFRTEFLQMGKIAVDMGKKFSFLGISSKDIARDMAFLTTNSGKFGRVTKEAMAAASVTVRSYGLELKDVAGILDQFADFESAATTASKFAQSFGTILDPIKLMKEENPAKAFEYLRNQMLAAGQSAETMNKAQIKQLATLSGMDENNVRLAFSNKNVGKSYEQIQKEAEKSGKKQKSQQEIMQDLGNSIKRVVEAIQHSGSFLSEFFAGFGEGIARSEKGKKVLYDLASLLRGIRHLGREVGVIFVKAFPGVSKMFDGLHEILTGKDALGNLVTELSESFHTLFKDLGSNPAEAVKKFFTDIEKMFSGGKGLTMINEGFGEFKTAISGVFAGLLQVLIENIAMGLDELAKLISNPTEYLNSAAGFADSFFSPIILSLEKSLPKLWESLKNVMITALFKYGPTLAAAMGAVFAVYFGSALAFGILQVAITSGFTIFMKALGTMLMSALTATAATPPPGATLRVNVFLAELRTVMESLRAFPNNLIFAAAKTLAIMSGTLILALGATMLSLIGLAHLAAEVPEAGMINMTKIFTMAITALLAGVGLAVVGAAAGASVKVLIPGLLIAALGLVAIGGFIYAISKFSKDIDSWLNIQTLNSLETKLASLNKAMFEIAKFSIMLATSAIAGAVVAGVAAAIGSFVLIGKILSKTPLGMVITSFVDVESLFGELTNILPNLVKYVTEINDSINTINFDSSKITAFVSLIAGLATTVAALMGGTIVAAFATPAIILGFSSVESLLDIVKIKIPPIIKSLLKTVNGIPSDDLGSKVSAVTGTLEAIMGLMSPLTTVAEILSNPKANELFRGGSVRGVGDILGSISGFIIGVGSQAKTIVENMINVVKDVPEESLKKVEVALSVLKAVGNIMSPMSNIASNLLSKSGGSGQPNMAAMKKIIEFSSNFMMALVEKNIGNIFKNMMTIANSIQIDKIKGLDKKFDFISKIFEVIGRAADLFTRIGGPEEATKVIIGAHSAKGVAESIGRFFESAEYKRLISSIELAPQISSKKVESVQRSLDNMLTITSKMGQISSRVDKINEAYGFVVFDTLNESMRNLIELNLLLDELKVGDIDATIDTLAGNLVGRKSISIENKPININVNFNIQFDALKFTNSVFTVANNATKMEDATFKALNSRTKADVDALKNTVNAFPARP